MTEERREHWRAVAGLLFMAGVVAFMWLSSSEPIPPPYWLTEKTYKGDIGQGKIYCNAYGDCEIER